MLNHKKVPSKTFLVEDCVYPDYEGGYVRKPHKLKDFDKDGFCRICGRTIKQLEFGT